MQHKGGLSPVKLRASTIAQEERTSVLYEAPHRLLQLLKELIEQCGAERPVQVARELTKRHEEQVGPTLGAPRLALSTPAPTAHATLLHVINGCRHAILPIQLVLTTRASMLSRCSVA